MHEVFVSVLTDPTAPPDTYTHTHTLKKIKIKKDVRKTKGFVLMTIAFRLSTAQLQTASFHYSLRKRTKRCLLCFRRSAEGDGNHSHRLHRAYTRRKAAQI